MSLADSETVGPTVTVVRSVGTLVWSACGSARFGLFDASQLGLYILQLLEDFGDIVSGFLLGAGGKGSVILTGGGHMIFVVGDEATNEIFQFLSDGVGCVAGVAGGARSSPEESGLGFEKMSLEKEPGALSNWPSLPCFGLVIIEAAGEYMGESGVDDVTLGDGSVGVGRQFLDILQMADEVFEATGRVPGIMEALAVGVYLETIESGISVEKMLEHLA